MTFWRERSMERVFPGDRTWAVAKARRLLRVTVVWAAAAAAAGLVEREAKRRGSDRTGQGTWSRLQSERRSSLFSASTRRWYSFTDTTW